MTKIKESDLDLTKKDITITEVTIKHIPQTDKGTVGFCGFLLCGVFKIQDAMIVKSSNSKGYRLVYPLKYDKYGKSSQPFAPIVKEIAEEIENQILEEYKKRIK